ncbi:MAG: phosphoribosylformylglycinamidine cyclo-ligase [Anaerolineae bacterium]|nr:phosphoribosylformylglycinamidine cyclo-ligase [Anaerolineae bacterium]
MSTSAYRAAGVDIDAGNRAVELMRSAVCSTYGPEVLAGIGAFGGLYDASRLQAARHPVLVASTDGVGTKTRLALALNRVEGLGEDIVNHCINDILVQGARPIFFLDYVAMPRLDAEIVARIVGGAARACRAAGCALLGGETAEMPGVYAAGELDLVGTIVGWVERDAIVDGSTIVPGDVAVGFASSGLHTNGYSLARRALAGESMAGVRPELDRSLGDALLEPHRSYLPLFERLQARVRIKGMAHITGGGFDDNLPRVLPTGVGVHLDPASWPVPPLFRLIQEKGRVQEAEMYRVFNMGIGLVAFVAPADVGAALESADGGAWVIGEAVPTTAERVIWPWSGSQS